MVELAEIFRLHGPDYRAKFGSRMLPSHLRAMQDIEQCRTAALGGVSHPDDPGFTWPLHGEDPFTPIATPFQRIDLVFTRGERVDALGVDLIGNTTADLTPTGLWPSDHAGLVASFTLEPCSQNVTGILQTPPQGLASEKETILRLRIRGKSSTGKKRLRPCRWISSFSVRDEPHV